MPEKHERDELVQRFRDAALALAAEGLSMLDVRKAVLVDAALRSGADVCVVFATLSGVVVGALHPLCPDADPVEIFRVEISPSGTSH